jgi:hypothetical protein
MKIATSAALAGVVLVSGVSLAQGQAQGQAEDASFQTADDPSWTLEIAPLAYYVAPSGKLNLPSSTTAARRVELKDLNMDSPRLSPMGTVSVRSGNWRFGLSGFYFSAEDRSSTQDVAGQVGDLAFGAGDQLSTSLDFWTVEATAGYRVLHRELGPRPEGGHKVVFDITPLVGIRLTDVDFSIDRVGGGSVGHSETFIEPIAGARLDLELVEQFSISLHTTVGYWPDTDLSWDIMPTFSWRPVPWFGAQIGYRQIMFDLESGSGAGEFRWDGAMAGLLFGCELRF